MQYLLRQAFRSIGNNDDRFCDERIFIHNLSVLQLWSSVFKNLVGNLQQRCILSNLNLS